MKKTILLGSVALSMCALPAMADLPPSASTDIYDVSTAWDNEGIIQLFANAWNSGRNFPTKEEFKTKGVTTDLEFVRSHTRYRNIAKDASKDIVQDDAFNHDRVLWCNLPGGYGKIYGGYPHVEFDQDVFSMWNYTSLFGMWNYGFMQASGAWVDAAHRNGTRIFGGIKFFEGWNNDGSEGSYATFIKTKADAGSQYTYKYSRAFINASAYFGNDGIQYNNEGSSHRNDDYLGFHAELRKIANELGMTGFGIGNYQSSSSLDASSVKYAYGSPDFGGVVYDAFLNYSGNKFNYRGVQTTLSTLESLGMSAERVYQGHLLVGLSSDYWREMNTATTNKINICIWGEHDQSRFFQFRLGEGPTNIQENYQLLLEKAFSGAYRNPLKRPVISNSWGEFQSTVPNLQLTNSPGFASMFPERTAIVGSLPFQTYFSLGNGENYFYKGKTTLGAWYNMSQQDIVPTYRWLVTKKGQMREYANDIDVRFTHEDAYIGGSSIRLSGATSEGNDVILYRTQLKVSVGNPQVTIALKRFAAGKSNLSVILKKEGSNNWIEVPTSDLKTAGWEEQTLPVAGLAAGDVIEYIGLRVNGTTDAKYKVLVGQLKISDDRLAQQAAIAKNSLTVEIKEETPISLSVKMNWEPDYTGYTTSVNEFGMVYNDEINVDHFEIFVKDSADGDVREVARTSQWAAFVGGIPLTQQQTDAYIGVRSVSEDLKCMSEIEWVKIPRYTGTLPEVEEEDPYGRSWMSSNGNGTLANCVKYIFVDAVTTKGATQDLNYNNTTGKNPLEGISEEQYYFAKDYKLVLSQGDRVQLTFKGHESNTAECIEYDFLNAYIDYDGNCSFLDKDEVLGKFGTLNAATKTITTPGLTIEFTVPADAHIGTSRLRIVASDAWTPHPGPTGGTVKGYTIDFPVEIKGNNVTGQRGPAETYKDLRDKGDADEPENVDGAVYAYDLKADANLSFPKDEYTVKLDDNFDAPVATGDTDAKVAYSSSKPDVASVDAATGKVTLLKEGTTIITATVPETDQYKDDSASYTLYVGAAGIEDVNLAKFSAVTIEGKYARFTATDEAWFYDVNGRVVKYVPEVSEPVFVGDLAAGVYVVKMLNGQIIRSAKVVIE